jgi:flagella basal body P-ring formation protein FlgA
MGAGMLSLAMMAWMVGAEAPSTLLAGLRAQRPDVVRWETRPTALQPDAAPDPQVLALGRIGARMPVRFVDGRVRWYVVAGFRPVPVSRHELTAGDTLSLEALETAERDVIALGCDPVVLDASRRWRVKRTVSAGEALCASDVESAPEVERDRKVTLSTERAGVHVSRPLTAANDARLGERVRLRDRASGATVIAIVTGPGAARVPE